MNVDTDAELSDAALVERMRAGNDPEQEGFRQLYERYASEVLGLAQRLLGGAEGRTDQAQDVLQETFVRLFQALFREHAYDAGRPLRPYVLGIARNAALSRLRRLAKEGVRVELRPEDTHTASAGETALARERGRQIEAALSALPPEQRSALLLKHEHGLTVREVAEALDCSERTARNRLRDAMRRFAGELRRRDLLDPDLGAKS